MLGHVHSLVDGFYLRCPTGWARFAGCRFRNWPCSSRTPWGRSSDKGGGDKHGDSFKHRKSHLSLVHTINATLVSSHLTRSCSLTRTNGTVLDHVHRVSPLGNSPWRTREAVQSSHTGCPPPPLSCTSHSDSGPCWLSERTPDTVCPSLIEPSKSCTWRKRREVQK